MDITGFDEGQLREIVSRLRIISDEDQKLGIYLLRHSDHTHWQAQKVNERVFSLEAERKSRDKTIKSLEAAIASRSACEEITTTS